MDAQKGSRASWAWSSLRDACDLVLNCAQWQIVNWSKTKVWIDHWVQSLPNLHSHYIAHFDFDPNLKFASMMDISTGTWHFDSIRWLISEEEVAAIMRVSIRSTTTSDRLIWSWEKSRKYTVKSCYHCLRGHSTRRGRAGASSSYSIDLRMWKLIWKIDCPLKIQNFLWRALKNILSTNKSLFRMKTIDSPTCNLCNTSVDYVEHILLLCPWVALVWFGNSLNIRICINEITTMNVSFHDELGKVDRA